MPAMNILILRLPRGGRMRPALSAAAPVKQ